MGTIGKTKNHELSKSGDIRLTTWANGKSGYIIDVYFNKMLRFVPANPDEIVDKSREVELAQPVIATGFIVHWLQNRYGDTRATYEGFYSECRNYYFEINRNKTLQEIEKLEKGFPQLHYNSCLADYKLSNAILPFLTKEEQSDLISHAMDYLCWLRKTYKQIKKGAEKACFSEYVHDCVQVEMAEGNIKVGERQTDFEKIFQPSEDFRTAEELKKKMRERLSGLSGCKAANVLSYVWMKHYVSTKINKKTYEEIIGHEIAKGKWEAIRSKIKAPKFAKEDPNIIGVRLG